MILFLIGLGTGLLIGGLAGVLFISAALVDGFKGVWK